MQFQRYKRGELVAGGGTYKFRHYAKYVPTCTVKIASGLIYETGAAYVEYNGTRHWKTNDTFDVPVGEQIIFRIVGKSSSKPGYVAINNVKVVNITSGSQLFAYTIPADASSLEVIIYDQSLLVGVVYYTCTMT